MDHVLELLLMLLLVVKVVVVVVVEFGVLGSTDHLWGRVVIRLALGCRRRILAYRVRADSIGSCTAMIVPSQGTR